MTNINRSNPGFIRSGRLKRTPFRRWLVLILAGVLALGALTASADGGGVTTRVSVASDGTQATNASFGGAVSDNGRYVAFGSEASNLVPLDDNSHADIFVYDRQTFMTTRASVSSNGIAADAPSAGPAISSEGRYVAFYSSASNLVLNDTNGTYDVFVRDRQLGTTTRVSVASNGTEGNGPSAGSYDGGRVAISPDGRYVAFASAASNLVPSDTNGVWDVFRHDRQTGVTIRISFTYQNNEGNADSVAPSISSDGQFIAFESLASNLVFGDLNSSSDVFVRDADLGTTQRVSVASDNSEADGHSAQASLSGDGQRVAFASDAANLVANDDNGTTDIFVRDRQANTMTRVSVATGGGQGDGDSHHPTISGDGRYVLFGSAATNLVFADTNAVEDIFYHDRQTGRTERVSIASDGTEANGPSDGGSLSADGKILAFDSYASNLVAGDTNVCVPYFDGQCPDVFVRERMEGDGERISGTVQLQGRSSFEGIMLTLVGPTTTATMSNTSGQFQFDNIAPGTYTVTATRLGWLCTQRVVSLAPGEQLVLPLARLWAGDLDGNGRVDLFDLVFVAAYYGSAASLLPAADLNDNGFIDLPDLILVSTNFGQTCPTPWDAAPIQAKQAPLGKAAPKVSLVTQPTGKDGLTVVEVWGEGLADVYGFDLSLRVDEKRVTVQGDKPFALDAALKNAYQVRNKTEGDSARLAAVLMHPAPALLGRVRLGTLTVKGDPKGLFIEGATWVDREGQVVR